MRSRQPPRLDERRESDFVDELLERARAWIPVWSLDDEERDFGRALLEIAARFDSEVAERLDECGEKMRRGFLDWLGIRGLAARPARVPVVFKTIDGTQESVLAVAPVTLQADAGGVPVIFETEKDFSIVPGKLDAIIAVESQNDAYFRPPPGLSILDPLEPLPTQWRPRGFAAAGSTKLQLEPDTGLAAGTIIQAGNAQYEVVQVDDEIITIEPALESDLQTTSLVTKVTTFVPFGGAARNQQEHALYLGHTDLLNVESSAVIEVGGAQALVTGFTWQYWGKIDGGEDSDWQTLTILPNGTPGAITLEKPKGEVEPRLIGTTNSRWIRAFVKTVDSDDPLLQVDALDIRVNPDTLKDCDSLPEETDSPEAQAMANTTPLVLDNVFFPLGQEPKQFDAFYLGCEEAFSKKSAEVQLCFNMAEPRFSGLSTLRSGPLANKVLADVAANGFLYLLNVNGGVVTPKGNAGGLVEGLSVRLDSELKFRMPIWGRGTQVFVAAAAKDEIHLRTHDTGNSANDRWRPLGKVGKFPDTINDASSEIDGLVFLNYATNGQLFALRESKLFVHDLRNENTSWRVVNPVAGTTVNLTRIAPIQIENGSSVADGRVADGLVGIADDEKLYEITGLDSGSPGWTVTEILTDVATDITPAAVRSTRLGNQTIAVAVGKDPLARDIKAYRSGGADDSVPLVSNKVIGKSVDVNLTDSHLNFSVCVENDSNVSELIAWSPFDPDDHAPLVRRNISARGFTPSGAPTLLPGHVLVPTSSNQVIVSEFKVRRITTAHKSALITSATLPVVSNVPVEGDRVAICLSESRSYQLAKVPSGETVDARTLFEFAFASDGGSAPDPDAFIDPSIGTIVDPANLDEIRIDRNGPELDPNTPLIITTDLSTDTYTVDSFDSGTRIATLDSDLDVVNSASPPSTVDYRFPATIGDPAQLDEITIDANAPTPSEDDFLLITTDHVSEPTKLYKVEYFNSTRMIVTLDRELEVNNSNSPPGTVDYRLPIEADAQLRPLLHLDATTGNWDATLLEDQPLLFPDARPRAIRAFAFSLQPGTAHPKYITLARHWTTAPPNVRGNIVFWVDPFANAWNLFLGDTTTNPELSWEYWNGQGWLNLKVLRDATQNLKTTGEFRFEVPDDVEPTDWAGIENFWIRARLVGGDYGKETVTIVTTPNGNTQTQTVNRSNEGIRAPSVLSLHIAYQVENSVRPAYVLAEDSGTIRDQSDANRTAGAFVEAFVPLSVTLNRLEGNTEEDATSERDEQRDNECLGDPATTVVREPADQSDDPSTSSPNRALLLGIDGPISGATVNLLMLVDERRHNDLAPIRVDALVANQFVPIVSSDATRAIGESGVISMTFAVPPTQSELFGQSLRWLRLAPRNADNADDWLPSLRGVYLNAVWASATETLTRELLGSATGQPNLVVTLARPPVLHDSLELRVRENLSKEEREALLQQDDAIVRSDVENLPGDWVLWKQVVDPLDEPASARVYSLDEETGEIRFGDGINGMIPPTGRDAIIAFQYRRTESRAADSDTVPGNLVTARTELNLVSPVSGVESVVAADQAAGGSPPESDESVLRFGFSRIRHRGRGVTLRDLEDLALQSSPTIVQARAFAGSGSVKLVVVIREPNPIPNAAQVRELHRLLVDATPVTLGGAGALRIVGPRVRKLRIRLQVQVESLDHAGVVAEQIKGRLLGYFDSAIGGDESAGWQLGSSPTENDVAFALAGTPNLTSLEKVKLDEVLDQDVVVEWPEELATDELAVLTEDPVEIQFATMEAAV